MNENMEFNTDIMLKAFVSGIFSAYLLIFGLRPSVKNPDIILEVFEHKWIFIILILINYYIFIWDYNNGVLFFLCILCLLFDYIVFTDKKIIELRQENNIPIPSKNVDNISESFGVVQKINTLDPKLFDINMIKELQNMKQNDVSEIKKKLTFF